MAEISASRAGQKRRKVMNAEVFETPDPEVTFQAYAPANAAARLAQGAAAAAADDAHFLDKGNVQLDEDAVAPSQAFEVFMGKVYKPTLSKQTEFEAAKHAKELEAPLARFTRLSVEIKELEADLTLLADAADAKKQRALVDAAQDAELDEVMRGLATLQSNLSAIEQNARFQPFLLRGGGGNASSGADAALALQKDLTARFFQQIDTLKRAQQGASAPTGDAPIVYEIYSNGELNAVDRDAKSRVAALEARLATLEKAIGNFHARQLGVDGLGAMTEANGAADMASAVAQLERRISMLSEKNLDAIKTRTTALLHEFSMLSKLKESQGVQGALATQADREKLQQTYDKLASVNDVAGAVPAIVDRLVSLKAVHDDTLQINQRVSKLEAAHNALGELIDSDAAVLANLEASLAANVEIFEANVQRLDERMEKLLRAGGAIR